MEINEKAVALYHKLDHIFEIDRAEQIIEKVKVVTEQLEGQKGFITHRKEK